jgi:hypothetical protein
VSRAVRVELTEPQARALVAAASFHFAGDELDWAASMPGDVTPATLDRAVCKVVRALAPGRAAAAP